MNLNDDAAVNDKYDQLIFMNLNDVIDKYDQLLFIFILIKSHLKLNLDFEDKVKWQLTETLHCLPDSNHICSPPPPSC